MSATFLGLGIQSTGLIFLLETFDFIFALIERLDWGLEVNAMASSP